MTSITDHGTSNIQYLSYGYDADNNVHTVTDNVTPANSKTLTYDAIDRLTNSLRIIARGHRLETRRCALCVGQSRPVAKGQMPEP
jgi:hypothetical protein